MIEGGDQVARVLAGVDWMLNFPVRVLNLSLGFQGYFDQYIPLLAKLLDKRCPAGVCHRQWRAGNELFTGELSAGFVGRGGG